jgi:hypothetical protein
VFHTQTINVSLFLPPFPVQTSSILRAVQFLRTMHRPIDVGKGRQGRQGRRLTTLDLVLKYFRSQEPWWINKYFATKIHPYLLADY